MNLKDVTGYEGLYKVSDCGKVFSLNFRGFGYKKEMKPSRDNMGHLIVGLKRNSKNRTFRVKLLVASHFIPNPDELDTIRHIDGNIHNNHVDNLEWVSLEQNLSDATKGNKNASKGGWSSKYPRLYHRMVNHIRERITRKPEHNTSEILNIIFDSVPQESHLSGKELFDIYLKKLDKPKTYCQ